MHRLTPLLAPQIIARIGSVCVVIGVLVSVIAPISEAEAVALKPDISEAFFEFTNVVREPNTLSVFTQQDYNISEDIDFQRIEEPTDDLYQGEEEVMQEGVLGQLTQIIRQTLWNNEVIDETVIQEDVTEPIDQLVRVGTKKRVYETTTDVGTLHYSDLYSMWSTSYDGNCFGCRGVTATGTVVQHGTCAVDPLVIPLGTRMYIPGYGICRAEDTGGAIKGMTIDLGFEDVRFGWWSSRWTDVYILTD